MNQCDLSSLQTSKVNNPISEGKELTVLASLDRLVDHDVSGRDGEYSRQNHAQGE